MCFIPCQRCWHNSVWNVIHSIVFMSILSIHAFSAICMVTVDHRMVIEGWSLFDCTWEEVGPGELPQLLRQLKNAMTPTSPATPGPSTPTTHVKTEPMEEEEGVAQQLVAMADLGASGFIEIPIMIKLGPHQYQYRCGNCNIAPRATKHVMDTYIHSVHTKKALLCSFCHFSTYNMNSLHRHEKEHK